MRRILAEVIKCVSLLRQVVGLLEEIKASQGRLEEQMTVLIEGPEAPSVTLKIGPVSEQ